MRQEYYDVMDANPVIAAVKDEKMLSAACKLEEIQVIFLLLGDLGTLAGLVEQVKEAGKFPVVHLDLVTGLGTKEIAVDFVKTYTKADGIISTKPALVRRGKDLGMLSILRVFLLDSMAFGNLERQVSQARPDFIEILPGVMPKMIAKVRELVQVPVIAGGLISDREDVLTALDAGALCVSTTKNEIWRL
ncbi:MAG: glycerol-3-phosphate responsive antiterminator [Fusicatenibacter sp.]|nr:glycerol-3-phosphate responsive antiterminator [Fusicatenibacter sp.]